MKIVMKLNVLKMANSSLTDIGFVPFKITVSAIYLL
jgi:hypothetical protein